MRAQVRKAYESYRGRLEFKYFSGLQMAVLLKEVARLPKHTVIIYSSIYKDGLGQAFVPIKALRLISPVANAPIFGAWNPFLGNGVIGGSVANLVQDGLDVGQLALDILRNGSGQTLPQIRHGKNIVMVDWRQLNRWGITTESLPPGSLVMYQEKGFWGLYKREALAVTSFILLESILIGVMLVQRKLRLKAETGLRLANEELEFRVRDRTVDLQNANQSLHVEMEERKKAQDALRDSEETLRGIFDTLTAGVILVDHNGTIIFANRHMAEMFGYPLGQLIGSTYIEHTHNSESEETQWKISHLIEGVIDHVSLDRLYQRLDGVTFWGRLSGRSLFHPDGSFWALLCMIQDITEQRNLESQLRQAQKMEAIGTLAGGIAHDFNNILTAIIGYTEIALGDAEDGKADPAALQGVLQAAMRAKGLVQQILAFSRRADSQHHLIDVNKEISATAELLRQTLPKMIEINLDLSEEIDPVSADPFQIQQIVMNLGTNSRDAMSGGGGHNDHHQPGDGARHDLPGMRSTLFRRICGHHCKRHRPRHW